MSEDVHLGQLNMSVEVLTAQGVLITEVPQCRLLQTWQNHIACVYVFYQECMRAEAPKQHTRSAKHTLRSSSNWTLTWQHLGMVTKTSHIYVERKIQLEPEAQAGLKKISQQYSVLSHSRSHKLKASSKWLKSSIWVLLISWSRQWHMTIWTL